MTRRRRGPARTSYSGEMRQIYISPQIKGPNGREEEYSNWSRGRGRSRIRRGRRDNMVVEKEKPMEGDGKKEGDRERKQEREQE